jgi:hypothetical protein
MGLDIERPPVGCCGHAGAFGYEAEHYPVSVQIAEQVLFPAVREAPSDTIVIADGFSCREQIKDGVGRWAMHPVEVMALAIERRGGIWSESLQHRYLEPAGKASKGAIYAAAGTIGAVLALTATAAVARRR